MSDNPNPRPLLTWPDIDSIRQTVLALVATSEDGDDEHQHSQADHLDPAELLEAAPNLESCIHAQMDDYDMPQNFLEIIDQEQLHVANQVLLALPNGERAEIRRRLLLKSRRIAQPPTPQDTTNPAPPGRDKNWNEIRGATDRVIPAQPPAPPGRKIKTSMEFRTTMQIDPQDLMYLAAPYSSDDPQESEVRRYAASAAASVLIHQGATVFSPLSYEQPLLDAGLKLNAQEWYEFDLTILRRCNSLTVLTLPGWEKSHGIKLEIKEAKKMGIPIRYVSLQDLNLGQVVRSTNGKGKA